MPTLRIECVDSFIYNPDARDASYNGETIPKNHLTRSGELVRARPYHSYYPALNACFSFNNLDLSFLNTAKLIACTMRIYCSSSTADDYIFYVDSMGYRMPPTQSDDSSLAYILSKATLSEIPGTQGWHTIDIANVSDIMRIVNGGMMIEYKTGRGSGVYSDYAGNRSQASMRPYVLIEYEDDNTPPTVRPISPTYQVVDGSVPVTFTWEYSQTVNAPQSHFDLQYWSAGAWVTLANKIASAAHRHTVPGGTLLSGMSRWRVRAYLKGSITSAWAETEIVIQAAPPTPDITSASNTPRPVFVWQAAQQSGFQVQVLVADGAIVHDSGEVGGTQRTWTYPAYLPDGQYTFRVRVGNSFGLWSQWASTAFAVLNAPPGTIDMQCQNTRKHSIALQWTTETSFAWFYVLRNGVPIAWLDGSARAYEDAMAHGRNTYKVRGTKGQYYADSAEQTDTVKVAHAVLAPVGSTAWVDLEYRRGGLPTHQVERAARVIYRQYEGKALPVAHKGPQREATHTLAFSFRRREDYLRLMELENQTVIYKDCMGERIVGNMAILSSSLQRVYDFEIAIIETEYREEVDYA